jgi:DNA-binding Lrp family transcriptional regulator
MVGENELKIITKADKKKKVQDEVLISLLENPTFSVDKIARKIKSYRQGVWRSKKRLEDSGIIWGYTAVIDEKKLGHIIYIVLMKTKPMVKGLAELFITRINKDMANELQVRLTDLWYVNGEFDWVMRFSAPNHSLARRYYDTLRVVFEKYLLEKPVIMDVTCCVVAEGKKNPHVDELYDFVVKDDSRHR